METMLTFLVIGLFTAGIVWFVWRQVKIDRRQRAELAALAADRGWRLETGQDGRRKVTTLTPADETWRLKLVSGYSTGSKNNRTNHPGYTELHLNNPALTRGYAIFSQRMPGGMEKMLGGSGIAGFLQNSAVKSLLSRVVPADILDNIGQLVPLDPPPGLEISILASEDPRGRDLRAVHEAIHDWVPRHQRSVAPPAVTMGHDGTRYRLSARLHEADDIASFIEQGCNMAQRLSA